MVATEVDLSSVVATYGSATWDGTKVTVTGRSVFYFSADSFELDDLTKYYRVEITFSPISRRSMRLYSRNLDGSSSDYYLWHQGGDTNGLRDRIGDTVVIYLAPSDIQWYEGTERCISYEAWSSSYTGVSDQILKITYEQVDGPLEYRSVVLDEFDIPCPEAIQGQSSPNAQATIPSANALQAADGTLVQMPYKVDAGGSAQSPTVAAMFPAANEIPAQFDALAEVRVAVRARSRTTNLAKLYVEGYGSTNAYATWNSRIPVYDEAYTPSWLPAGEPQEFLSYPLVITPDDVRAGRFGVDQTGQRRLGLSISDTQAYPTIDGAEGFDIDYLALRIRLVSFPVSIQGVMLPSRRRFEPVR